MAIDPSISLNAKAPDATASLSSMLDMRGKMLGIKKAQATLDSEIAQQQAQSQSAQAKAQVDQANINPLIAQQQADTSTAQTDAQSHAFDLQNKKHQQTIGTITGLIGDESVRNGDGKGIMAALDAATKNAIAYGANPEEVQASIAPIMQMAQSNPKMVQPVLINLLRQGLQLPNQASVAQPSGPMMNTGQVQYQVNTNPLSAAPQGPVAGTGAVNQIPVGTQVFDPGTNAPAITAPGGAIQSGPALGVPAQIEANQEEVKSIRSAGDQVPTQRNINQSILKLSKDTTTGPGSAIWQKALGATSLGQFGDNYQELGKYLEKNAIANMNAMGGSPSDARLQAAAAANGSTQYNPKALQEVTKFNDAATTAMDKYRQGVDRAVGLRNQDVNALPEFKSAWAKNLDPNIFRAENAIRDNDTMELQKLKSELGEKGLKELARKRAVLEKLSATGKAD